MNVVNPNTICEPIRKMGQFNSISLTRTQQNLGRILGP
jgi:hypothetical protein